MRSAYAAASLTSCSAQTTVFPARASRAKQREDFVRDAHVEMTRRFVEQQDRRLLGEAERNPDALALARAQRRKETLGERLDVARPQSARATAASSLDARATPTSDDAETGRSRRRRERRSASSKTSSPVTNAMRRARSSAPICAFGGRRRRIAPRAAGCSPAIARSSVVLPTPLAPSSATNSPLSTRASMPSSKRRVRRRRARRRAARSYCARPKSERTHGAKVEIEERRARR